MDITARQKLRDFLMEALAKHGDHGELSDAESIFVSGRMDSFSMINLVMFLEEAFDISFSDDEFDVDLLDSVDDLAAYIDSKHAG
jgi:acyl carrier protein